MMVSQSQGTAVRGGGRSAQQQRRVEQLQADLRQIDSSLLQGYLNLGAIA